MDIQKCLTFSFEMDIQLHLWTFNSKNHTGCLTSIFFWLLDVRFENGCPAGSIWMSKCTQNVWHPFLVQNGCQWAELFYENLGRNDHWSICLPGPPHIGVPLLAYGKVYCKIFMLKLDSTTTVTFCCWWVEGCRVWPPGPWLVYDWCVYDLT